jgi:polysaccharide biosynthesis transport protein
VSVLSRRRRIDQSKVPAGSLLLLDDAGAVQQMVPPAVAESMRLMVARLRVGEELPRRIGLISTIQGEGVSFLACTLGLLLTHDTPKTVCLVDLNWWSAGSPGDSASPGVSDVVKERASLSDVLVSTGNPGLTLLHAGDTSIADRPYLSNSVELENILTELEEEHDHLILDLPALSRSADALTLAQKADALIFVVQQGVTPESEAKRALEQLQGLNVLGAVLNRSSSRVPGFVRRRIVRA